jgi:phosphatidylinositol alpha-mannosyltransferase
MFPVGDAAALAGTLAALLDDPARRAELTAAGVRAVAPYDWVVVADQIVRVYELAIAGAGITGR